MGARFGVAAPSPSPRGHVEGRQHLHFQIGQRNIERPPDRGVKGRRLDAYPGWWPARRRMDRLPTHPDRDLRHLERQSVYRSAIERVFRSVAGTGRLPSHPDRHTQARRDHGYVNPNHRTPRSTTGLIGTRKPEPDKLAPSHVFCQRSEENGYGPKMSFAVMVRVKEANSVVRLLSRGSR